VTNRLKLTELTAYPSCVGAGVNYMVPTVTEELLARALVKLQQAERALQADSENKWLKMAVEVAREKVESIQRSLSSSRVESRH